MEDSLRLPNVSKSSWHIGCHGPVGCGSLLPTVDFITGDISQRLSLHTELFNDSQDRTHQSNCGPMRKRWRISQRCFRSIVKDFSPVGEQAVKEAMCEDVATKNEFIRRGGFSSQQWVLGKAPRGVGQILDEQELGDLGVLESQVGGAAQFGRRSDMRFAARKVFVHEDCSRRSRAAVLRKAAPILKLEISSCTQTRSRSRKGPDLVISSQNHRIRRQDSLADPPRDSNRCCTLATETVYHG